MRYLFVCLLLLCNSSFLEAKRIRVYEALSVSSLERESYSYRIFGEALIKVNDGVYFDDLLKDVSAKHKKQVYVEGLGMVDNSFYSFDFPRLKLIVENGDDYFLLESFYLYSFNSPLLYPKLQLTYVYNLTRDDLGFSVEGAAVVALESYNAFQKLGSLINKLACERTLRSITINQARSFKFSKVKSKKDMLYAFGIPDIETHFSGGRQQLSYYFYDFSSVEKFDRYVQYFFYLIPKEGELILDEVSLSGIISGKRIEKKFVIPSK